VVSAARLRRPGTASRNCTISIAVSYCSFSAPIGEHWLQGDFRDSNKRHCLVGAIAYLRRKHRISRDGTVSYLNDAIQIEWQPPAWSKPAQSARLIFFNDNRRKSFDDLRTVLIKARIRAARESQPEFIAAKAAAIAHAYLGLMKFFLGRAGETRAHVEDAIRLSPRDPLLFRWRPPRSNFRCSE
jgi:hypothetical protein